MNDTRLLSVHKDTVDMVQASSIYAIYGPKHGSCCMCSSSLHSGLLPNLQVVPAEVFDGLLAQVAQLVVRIREDAA